jgi:hypothetical protein
MTAGGAAGLGLRLGLDGALIIWAGLPESWPLTGPAGADEFSVRTSLCWLEG